MLLINRQEEESAKKRRGKMSVRNVVKIEFLRMSMFLIAGLLNPGVVRKKSNYRPPRAIPSRPVQIAYCRVPMLSSQAINYSHALERDGMSFSFLFFLTLVFASSWLRNMDLTSSRSIRMGRLFFRISSILYTWVTSRPWISLPRQWMTSFKLAFFTN